MERYELEYINQLCFPERAQLFLLSYSYEYANKQIDRQLVIGGYQLSGNKSEIKAANRRMNKEMVRIEKNFTKTNKQKSIKKVIEEEAEKDDFIKKMSNVSFIKK